MSNAPSNHETEKARPVDQLRDGSLNASIWMNESDRGAAFNTTFSRTYKKENGEYGETRTMRSQDLLSYAELSRAAYHRVSELRSEYKQSPEDFKAARQAQREGQKQAHSRER